MKERILEFLRIENKSSAQFAAEIGVQPSSVSHIISGRNNPSLEFIIKMLTRYPSLSSDWILFGKGNIFNDGANAEISAADLNLFSDNEDFVIKKPDGRSKTESAPAKTRDEDLSGSTYSNDQITRAVKIVFFYADNTFSEYFPGTD